MSIVNDSFTDAAATLLQNHTSTQDGTTWTKHPAYTSFAQVITASGRLRNSQTSTSLYYASGVPATADYDVQADCVWVGGAADPVGGLLPLRYRQ
jgi:hypothetical protein